MRWGVILEYSGEHNIIRRRERKKRRSKRQRCNIRRTQFAIVALKKEEEAMIQGMWVTEKGKEMDSLLEPPQGTEAPWNPLFTPVKLMSKL